MDSERSKRVSPALRPHSRHSRQQVRSTTLQAYDIWNVKKAYNHEQMGHNFNYKSPNTNHAVLKSRRYPIAMLYMEDTSFFRTVALYICRSRKFQQKCPRKGRVTRSRPKITRSMHADVHSPTRATESRQSE